VQEVTKGGQGNTPKDERNALILAEWKEVAHKNRSRFAREYCEKDISRKVAVPRRSGQFDSS